MANPNMFCVAFSASETLNTRNGNDAKLRLGESLGFIVWVDGNQNDFCFDSLFEKRFIELFYARADHRAECAAGGIRKRHERHVPLEAII